MQKKSWNSAILKNRQTLDSGICKYGTLNDSMRYKCEQNTEAYVIWGLRGCGDPRICVLGYDAV